MPHLDATTFEILRHRLWQITDEMAVNLKRVSGSSVTVDSNDLMTALYTASGDLLVAGPGVLLNASTIGAVCKSIIRDYSDEPGFEEGDMYLLNDPYLGVPHQLDVSIVSPIYHQDRLVAWSGSLTHVSDIGGMEPGSFCYRAQDIFQEGLRVPGLKFVEKGKVRKDIFDTILAQSRDPQMVALDLKGQIAANNTAGFRYKELVSRYGVETASRMTTDLMDYSETKLTKRLSKIPDGTWRTKQYLDDGKTIHKVQLSMRKAGGKLEFDFDGTSKQSSGFVNCTLHGTRGGVVVPLCALLCFDVPWNEGMLRPMSVKAPAGCLVNPNFPAPTSMASVSAIQVVINASTVVVSKMLSLSPETKLEATAVWRGSVFPPQLNGRHKKTGRYVVGAVMDSMAGGCGARAFRDGVDTGGTLHGVRPLCPNVETNELRFPILFIFRRQRRDSGGAGRYRGGLGGEDCFMIHGAQGDRMSALYWGMGFEVPQSSGVSGGDPALAVANSIIRNSNILDILSQGRIPESLEEIAGRVDEIRPQTETELLERDVAYFAWAGGGGYGDPVARDPELVLADVVRGRVSQLAARELYGVVIGDGPSVDQRRTDSLREEMKVQRLAGSRVKDARIARETGVGLTCSNCGYLMSTDGHTWNYLFSLRQLADLGLVRSRSSPMLLREYVCPSCATVLETEVTQPHESPSLDDITQAKT